MMLKNWKIKENIIKVLKTYPIVLSCFFIIGALGVLLIHNDSIDEELILKINFSIAIFAGFAINLKALKIQLEKFNQKQYLVSLFICLGLSIGYYFTLNMDNDWTMIRTLIISFIQGLLFISLPFIKNDDKAEHFVNLAAGRLIISGLLYGIAYGGIAGILFALEELFGLDISYKIYSDVAIILATTFLPMLWLFGLDYQVEPTKKKLYKVLLSFVCIPLLFVYSAVVYGFIIKIVANGFRMPSSIIGHLVLWYSFVSIIVSYLARPYEDSSITKFFYRWYPLVSVLPIVVMFIAIFLRINQYGMTISRYCLLLGGIWLALMFAYLILVRFAKKKRLNIVITLSIALFALISILEPISAYTIAEKSQVKRLEETMIEYISDDTFDINDMDEEDIAQAQSILNYLNYNHGYDIYYENSDTFNRNIDFLTVDQANEILAVNIYKDDFNSDVRRYLFANNRREGKAIPPLNVEGYKYLQSIGSYDFNDENTYDINEYQLKVEEVTNNDNETIDSIITIYKDTKLLTELSLIECYGDRLLSKKEVFGEEYEDFIYETQDKSVKIVLNNIDFWYSDEIGITSFSGNILLK